MTFMAQIALILGTLSAAGVLCDRLLVGRHKKSLHTKLVTLWDRIDDTRIGNLPGAIANSVLRFFERIFGTSLLNRRVVILSIVFSWLLTTAESVMGTYLYGEIPHRVWHDWLPFWPAYLCQYIFNSATIIVTVSALRHLRYASVDTGGTALMEFADISKAYFSLFRTGHVAVHRVLFTAPVRGRMVSTVQNFQISAKGLLWNAQMLFLITLLLAVVVAAALAKTLLSFARFASLSVLEAAADADPSIDPKSFMPGTLLGTLLGVVGAIIRGMTELVRLK